jgi:hypothetical protein
MIWARTVSSTLLGADSLEFETQRAQMIPLVIRGHQNGHGSEYTYGRYIE